MGNDFAAYDDQRRSLFDVYNGTIGQSSHSLLLQPLPPPPTFVNYPTQPPPPPQPKSANPYCDPSVSSLQAGRSGQDPVHEVCYRRV